jgi:hypothetical protein
VVGEQLIVVFSLAARVSPPPLDSLDRETWFTIPSTCPARLDSGGLTQSTTPEHQLTSESTTGRQPLRLSATQNQEPQPCARERFCFFGPLASVRSDISWASSFTYNYGDVVAHVRCTRLEYTQFVFKVISMKYWNDDLFPNR